MIKGFSFGFFNPVHDGHIDLLRYGAQAAEKLEVYISPGRYSNLIPYDLLQYLPRCTRDIAKGYLHSFEDESSIHKGAQKVQEEAGFLQKCYASRFPEELQGITR